ncbi:MAG: S8 family serine peptidase [Ignavibacteria bacterium]
MNHTKKIFIALFFAAVIFFVLIFSESKNVKSDNNYLSFYDDHSYREGELLVMLKPGVQPEDFIKGYTDINLRVKREVFLDYNIWLFEYEPQRSAPVDALLSVMGSRDVAIAQFNHEVELRETIPNDSRFNEMWALKNTGQTGGTPGADVKATFAWDVTTGGLTSTGDTIVVAMVDGGCLLTHPDLVDNIWRNWGEVPGNGIDDEGNGYVDDVNGWNAYNNSGNVPSNSHGTHVAGTVGAIGNNNTGVTGVSWNVKVMNIAGSSGDESTVVTAYAYALKQRKIYNQTNGSQGAFVVATSSSFGVNYGNPANYPIWCAFYDSLGVNGILSAGATMNINANVDITGDIPTACPSDFMISVTNTTNTDVKNSGAAYGPTTIDLGAPGTSILSTESNGSYSLKTGTSMATPHVAGAIGLLYSAASPLYMNLAKTQPDSAGRLFKHLLLSTVDTLASLQGLLVSEGRLNLEKFINSVRTTYVPVLHPFALQSPAPGVTITSFPQSTTPVTISWDTSATGATYKWIFGMPLPSRLMELSAGTNSLTLTLGYIDEVLAGFGVQPGQSVSGQWDVWAYRMLPQNDSLKSSNGPRSITLERGIPQLSAFNLNSPPNNTTITTSVFNNSQVNFNWTKSGDGTTYRWKFGSPNISTVLLNVDAEFDSSYSFVNSGLDVILSGIGLDPGDSIVGQWAVWAYNGLDSIKSTQTYNITFKRQDKGDFLVMYDSTSSSGRTSRDSVINVLNQLNKTYDLFNRGGQTSTDAMTMRGYKGVILLGQGTSVLSTKQKDSVIAYLNSGGTTVATKSKLIIFSEDVGYQFGRNGSTYQDLNFINNYLGWDFVADRPGASQQGLIGSYINSGLADSTIGSWPEVIKKHNQPGTSQHVLYLYRRHINNPDSAHAIGMYEEKWNVATFGTDVRSIRNANGGASGGPVHRILKAAIDYVNEEASGLEPVTGITIPERFELSQNYPNPFNPTTKINFAIAKQGLVTLKIFDITGREVATLVNQTMAPGYYSIDFNASVLSSGVYFYRLHSADFIDVKRMVLLK